MRVFVLEDSSHRIRQFREAATGSDLTVATSYDEAIATFCPPYDLVCLDHDLGEDWAADPEIENTGYSFAKWLPQA